MDSSYLGPTMWKPAKALTVNTTDRALLQALLRSGKTPQRVALRATIILRAAEGHANHAIAKELGTSRPTVLLWRARYREAGIPGLLKDAPRPGRRKTIGSRRTEAIVNATLHTTPRAATHWSCRSMARAQGISPATVQRIWQAHGLQPHRSKSFKLSRDPQFVQKLRDVVGLYLNPPEKALVLCVDEKSQIQALDRTAPILPLRPGIPERQTHDYIRHGTTTLFAALNVLDGTVIGSCAPRHRHTEFIAFLERIDRETPRRRELHLILDNYRTHKHKNVKQWLADHPRFHLHFVPTSSSWLNLVERWFAEITRKRIRRGTFRSVPALIRAIRQYLQENNKNPRPFMWTASAAKILRKIRHCQEALDTGH
jgi:transposase